MFYFLSCIHLVTNPFVKREITKWAFYVEIQQHEVLHQEETRKKSELQMGFEPTEGRGTRIFSEFPPDAKLHVVVKREMGLKKRGVVVCLTNFEVFKTIL